MDARASSATGSTFIIYFICIGFCGMTTTATLFTGYNYVTPYRTCCAVSIGIVSGNIMANAFLRLLTIIADAIIILAINIIINNRNTTVFVRK